jgi:hypothetical protein
MLKPPVEIFLNASCFSEFIAAAEHQSARLIIKLLNRSQTALNVRRDADLVGGRRADIDGVKPLFHRLQIIAKIPAAAESRYHAPPKDRS